MKRTILYILLLPVCTHLWAQVDTVSVHTLDSVEVQGKRFQVSGSWLNSADFSRLNITDINSALQRLPSITLHDYGGAGGMKTVSVRGLGVQHTGVSYDGIMLSEIQGGQIDLSRFNIEDVESISLTIGGDANIFQPARQLTSASLLSIETMPAGREDRRSIVAELKSGSFGYVNPYVRYRQPIGGKFALSVTADYIHADNDYRFLLKNGVATEWRKRTNSRMNSGHGDVSLSWQPTLKTMYNLKLYYYDNNRQLPGLVRYYTDLNEETLRDRNAFVQVSGLQVPGSRFQVQEKVKWNWQMTDYRNPLYVGNIMDTKYWQREYYATASVGWNVTHTLALSYSIDFIHNNLNSTRETDSEPWRTSLLQALSAKYELSWLTATASLLRSDYYNGEKIKKTEGVANAHRFSPTINISFCPLHFARRQKSTLHLNIYYKDIFRMPTFNELYFYHLGSQNLKPEDTKMLGAGMDYSIKSKHGFLLSASFDVYRNSIKNKISAVPYNIFVWKCVNLYRAGGLGADLRISGSKDFGKGHKVSLTGNYSYQGIEDRTEGSDSYGKQLAYIPRNSFCLVGSYENPWVNMSISEKFSGENWSDNEHYAESRLRGYVIWGASLWHEFRGFKWFKGVKVQVDINNVFNHQYSIIKGYPMPGRSIMTKLKIMI